MTVTSIKKNLQLPLPSCRPGERGPDDSRRAATRRPEKTVQPMLRDWLDIGRGRKALARGTLANCLPYTDLEESDLRALARSAREMRLRVEWGMTTSSP